METELWKLNNESNKEETISKSKVSKFLNKDEGKQFQQNV